MYAPRGIFCWQGTTRQIVFPRLLHCLGDSRWTYAKRFPESNPTCKPLFGKPHSFQRSNWSTQLLIATKHMLLRLAWHHRWCKLWLLNGSFQTVFQMHCQTAGRKKTCRNLGCLDLSVPPLLSLHVYVSKRGTFDMIFGVLRFAHAFCSSPLGLQRPVHHQCKWSLAQVKECGGMLEWNVQVHGKNEKNTASFGCQMPTWLEVLWLLYIAINAEASSEHLLSHILLQWSGTDLHKHHGYMSNSLWII